jgi:hypothetical protein
MAFSKVDRLQSSEGALKMTRIAARKLHFKDLNAQIRASEDPDIIIDDCIGHAILAAAFPARTWSSTASPEMRWARISTAPPSGRPANAQDATADTMGDGLIVINGSCGDGRGYGMRGGKSLSATTSATGPASI